MMKRRTTGFLGAFGLVGALVLAAPEALANTQDETPDMVPVSSFSGAFLAARAAEADNDLSSAIAYYERALSYDPGNDAIRQSLMLALISEGRFDAALPYAQMLKSVPEIERFSRLGLAVDAIRNSQFPAAEEWLNLVLESDLDRLITGIMKAWAQYGQGDRTAARAELDGLTGPAWYELFLRYHRGLMAAAASDASRVEAELGALLKNPGSASAAPDTYMRAIEAYAAFLAIEGKKEEALSVLDEAAKLVTGRAATRILREKVAAGDDVSLSVDGARAGAAEILLNVATALNRGGGEPFVKLYLNYALALAPESDDIVLQLASIAEQQSEPQKAIDYYGRIKPGSPWHRLAELQTGLNLADLDRHEEAITYLQRAVDEDPDDMRAYLSLGRVHAVKKDYRAAAEVYDRAVARIDKPQSDDWSIFYQRGIAYERLKEWEKAEPNFHKALELFPDQPQVLNYLGYSWVDMNMNLEEGLELIRRAVELRPNDGYIVDSLGWAYYRLGRFDEAVTELERAVSLRPEDPVLNDHLGDAYWRVGRRLEATYQWSHARDLEPEPDLLADVELKLKEGLAEAPVKKLAEAETPPKESDQAQPENAPNADDEPANNDGSAMPSNGEEAGSDGSRSHVIQPGETLWSIAADQLGDGERYVDIIAINPEIRRNPDRLRVGQEILLPQ